MIISLGLFYAYFRENANAKNPNSGFLSITIKVAMGTIFNESELSELACCNQRVLSYNPLKSHFHLF